jgi:hypothetical protein
VRWFGEQQGSVVEEEATPKVLAWPEPKAVVLATGRLVVVWALSEEWGQGAQAERVPEEKVGVGIRSEVESALNLRVKPGLPSSSKVGFVGAG